MTFPRNCKSVPGEGSFAVNHGNCTLKYGSQVPLLEICRSWMKNVLLFPPTLPPAFRELCVAFVSLFEKQFTVSGSFALTPHCKLSFPASFRVAISAHFCCFFGSRPKTALFKLAFQNGPCVFSPLNWGRGGSLGEFERFTF